MGLLEDDEIDQTPERHMDELFDDPEEDICPYCGEPDCLGDCDEEGDDFEDEEDDADTPPDDYDPDDEDEDEEDEAKL